MYQVDQVLVPLDFSSFSRSALAFARQLGRGRDDGTGKNPVRLQLAHAVEAMPSYVRSVLFPYAALGEDDREFEAEIAEAARHEMERYFEFDESLRGRFRADPIIEFGSSSAMIRRWCGRFEQEMIVAGAFGENGVFAGGLGSTSGRLVATATQPVALIRDYDVVPTVDRILAAVDLQHHSTRVVEVATALAIELNAELQLVHVTRSPFREDIRTMIKRHLDLELKALEAAIEPQLRGLFDDIVDTLQFPHSIRQRADELIGERTIRFGDPVEEIAEMAHQGEFDLVVAGANSHAAMGSGEMVSAVMARVPTHMVVVPVEHETTPLERWEG